MLYANEKKWNLTINAKINVGEVKTDDAICPFCPTFDYVLENYFSFGIPYYSVNNKFQIVKNIRKNISRQ